MDIPEKLATLGTQDEDKIMIIIITTTKNQQDNMYWTPQYVNKH